MADIKKNEIDITKEEFNQLKEAFKKEEFRKLFKEYVDEITDPENKALYEKEVTQFERERGIDVTFIHPKPGYVIKTSVDGKRKAFINVCASEHAQKPSSVKEVKDGFVGSQWSLPYLQVPPRDDLDKKRSICSVFDVIFHPDTLLMAKNDSRFKTFVNDIALTAVEDSYKVTLDRKNLKFPKMAYKGLTNSCVIRKKMNFAEGCNSTDLNEESENDLGSGIDKNIFSDPQYPYTEPIESPSVVCPRSVKFENPYTTPKYIIKQRKDLDLQEYRYSKDAKMNSTVPTELVIEVDLPLLSSCKDVELNLESKLLSLKSEKPAKYNLEVKLPYSVVESESTAKFDSSKSKLIVNARVAASERWSGDSGVESDLSGRGGRTSSDEDLSQGSEGADISPERQDSFASKETPEELSAEVEAPPLTTSPEATLPEPFLSPLTHYTLPPYTLTVPSTHSLLVALDVANVQPSTFHYRWVEEGCLLVAKFLCVGSGCFPLAGTVCLRLPHSSAPCLKPNFTAEQVLLNFTFTDTLPPLCFIGSSPTSLTAYALNAPTQEGLVGATRKLDRLCLAVTRDNDSDDEPDQPDNFLPLQNVFEENRSEVSNKVLKDSSQMENITGSGLTQVPSDTSSRPKLSNSDCLSSIQPVADKTNTPVDTSTDGKRGVEEHQGTEKPHNVRCTQRTLSESSDTLPRQKNAFRGILKVSRSLSESHSADYFSSSLEDTDEVLHPKKHVTFNDHISKQLFRANCSILGQRKKNQRKTRNKKRSAERRASESSGVSDVSDVSEVSDMSEVSEVSDVSESDDGTNNQLPVKTPTPGPKTHRRRGTKNHRKNANTAKIHYNHD